ISGSFTNGGSLVVSGPITMAAGDTFKLFSAAGYSGAFTNVILPTLRIGLGWDISQLNSDGIIAVIVTATPVIGSVFISTGGLSFHGGGGVGSRNFVLLGTTNLASPWSPLLTNQFDGSGNFNFTNPIGSTPQTFYRLQLQ
ncbi:MAG TPA: hypothetical protein VG347_15765, partial [Verrucomicrobiae bacterium]|nr:hypothetical protein [Verrucomicrobiae bacterium]